MLSLPLIVFIGVCGVVGLAPLMVYLAVLSRINDRERPTVLSGVWDLLGLVGGLSGFLIMGLVVFVMAVQSNARYTVRGDWDSLKNSWRAEQTQWAMSVGAYGLIVGAAVGFGILNRMGTLSVYGVDREGLEAAVDAALADAGIAASRHGNIWADGKDLIRIDPTPLFAHAVLHFPNASPRSQEELERNLRHQLARIESPDHSVGVWLLSASVSCFVTLLSCLFIVGYFTYLTT